MLAMMADKSIAESLHVLRACAKRWCLTTIPELARAAPVESILKHLSEGEAYTTFPSVADALETLLSSDHCDPILITGSFFTVAAATEYLMKTYGIGAERLRS